MAVGQQVGELDLQILARLGSGTPTVIGTVTVPIHVSGNNVRVLEVNLAEYYDAVTEMFQRVFAPDPEPSKGK